MLLVTSFKKVKLFDLLKSFQRCLDECIKLRLQESQVIVAVSTRVMDTINGRVVSVPMALHPRWSLVVTMKRNMARSGTQSAPNLGYSRIPSVSRAISAICRRQDSPLQVEFVGGSTRWRFVGSMNRNLNSSRRPGELEHQKHPKHQVRLACTK